MGEICSEGMGAVEKGVRGVALDQIGFKGMEDVEKGVSGVGTL